jgi:hypothetical protein
MNIYRLIILHYLVSSTSRTRPLRARRGDIVYYSLQALIQFLQFRDDHFKIGKVVKNVAKSSNIPDIAATDKALKASVPELFKLYNDFKGYDAVSG